MSLQSVSPTTARQLRWSSELAVLCACPKDSLTGSECARSRTQMITMFCYKQTDSFRNTWTPQGGCISNDLKVSTMWVSPESVFNNDIEADLWRPVNGLDCKRFSSGWISSREKYSQDCQQRFVGALRSCVQRYPLQCNTRKCAACTTTVLPFFVRTWRLEIQSFLSLAHWEYTPGREAVLCKADK